MAIAYGVTATGFVLKPYTEILAEVSAQLQAIFGNTINLDPSQPFGQWAAIQADREFLLWQLAQACYTARDPDGAQGQGLVELAAITGTIPFSPTPSVVTATLVGTSATVVPLGTVFSTAPAGVQFSSNTSATIGGTPPSWSVTTFATGSPVTSSGNIYLTLLGGTTTSGNAPTGTTFGTAITGSDGVTWYYLGTGTGLINVVCNSVLTGPQNCNLWTLNTIVTPVAGLNNVTNYTVQVNGQALETDTQLRTRRYVELAQHGSSNAAAITAALSALTTSTGGQVLNSEATYENDTDVTDAFGLPPHSIQAVVSYGNLPVTPVPATDQLIASTILKTKAAGVQTKGAQSKTVLDTSSNTNYTINFDYPTSTPCTVLITLRRNLGTSGVAYVGDAVLQSALQNWAIGQSANGQSILLEDGSGFPGYAAGQTIFTGQIATAVMEGDYGVLDVQSVVTTMNGVGPDNTPKLLTRVQVPAFTFNIAYVAGY
jgi:uncharacterized phage protein gp47/JayE